MFAPEMANRSYVYSLSNRPTAYEDRPETISGLSEWPYDVPFMVRLLMSGDPQLCASLISDGFDDEGPGRKTKLYAISSRFESGFERVKRFATIARVAASLPDDAVNLPQGRPLMDRLKRVFSARQPATVPPAASTAWFLAGLDETLEFLEAHRDAFLLLETVELDCMTEGDEAALRACVEREVSRCLRAGAALDALPLDVTQAASILKRATRHKGELPLDAFFGLRLDDDCDNTRDGATQVPLGLFWDEVLYFQLRNRAEFKAREQNA
ncbi:hypothetical protein CCO03_06810 [Comamonas serinivorans]|uniref:DUF7822 domain-containing protein n=2 Tax=Comamonas serinivorans TaxID=1082851 RepID=A0A1Y0ELB0_9BURK|nr:hypothetical protein CCO03_06810 [Comamonas serinivorans]